MRSLFGITIAFVLAACPGHAGRQIKVYRSVQEPGAKETCTGSNSMSMIVAKTGATEAAARSAGEAAVDQTVLGKKACGALMFQDIVSPEGNQFRYNASFQLCGCNNQQWDYRMAQ